MKTDHFRDHWISHQMPTYCDNSFEHSWKLVEDWSLIYISDLCFRSINGLLQVFVKRGVDEPVFQDRSRESILTEWSFRVLPTWATWESPQPPPMPMNEKNWTRVCFRCRAREPEKFESQNGCPSSLFLTFSYRLRSSSAKFQSIFFLVVTQILFAIGSRGRTLWRKPSSCVGTHRTHDIKNMETEDGQFVYTINGVKVTFPCKAYPTQLSMMNMVSLNLILSHSRFRQRYSKGKVK